MSFWSTVEVVFKGLVFVLITVVMSLFQQEGQTNTVQTLLSLGADINSTDERNRSGRKYK
jgi:hypothetical protein